MLTAEQRKAVIARAGRLRGKKRPTVKPVPHPRAAEIAYARSLKAYVRTIREAVLTHVGPVLDHDGDGVANTLPLGDLTRALIRVQEAVISATPAAERAAKKLLSDVSAHVLQGMNAAYEKAIGVRPFKEAPGRRTDAPTSVESVLAERLQANVYLIGSISGQVLGQVREVLDEGFRSGLRVEDLAKRIGERFDVAESRAILIARDQTGKLNAQLQEARNRDLGVTKYRWQISGAPEGDGRVRDMHTELNDTVQRYDDPPVTNPDGDRNNPGEDYQCRCTAQPELEDVLTSLGI